MNYIEFGSHRKVELKTAVAQTAVKKRFTTLKSRYDISVGGLICL